MFGYKLVKKKDISKLKEDFEKYNDFVEKNMVMVDSKGNSQDDYDEDEIGELWISLINLKINHVMDLIKMRYK